jgi:hypothetical protein
MVLEPIAGILKPRFSLSDEPAWSLSSASRSDWAEAETLAATSTMEISVERTCMTCSRL